ncbi:DUF6216 family protein [Nitrincola sp. MINF-07-Sa-05]|uniref:DUF6216 family protein n=1 Tax=Nitrincola salilacus TaxID=3400273 RepID=UPI003917F173
MEVETLKIVADISPWLSLVLLTVFAVIWFRLRAGTSYGLINRLYAIVIGGKEFHDNSVTEFWNERKDVERFNALFNTRAKSLKEVNLFIKWINRNDLDLRRLAKLNDLFDMEEREVKKGSYRLATIFFSVVGFVLVLLSIYLMELARKDAALIKFNDETQWMWLSHDAAYSTAYNPFRDRAQDWRLTAETCSQTPLDKESFAAQAKLKPENITNICESFTNAKDIQRIDEIINNQKSFVWLALAFLPLFLYCFNSALRLNSARQAKSYLKKKLGDTAARAQALDSEDGDSAPSQ